MPTPDPIAVGTLWATWAGTLAALFAAVSAVWIAHRSDARDDRRRRLDQEDQTAAFRTAVLLAIRKVGAMANTLEAAGDAAITRALFVGGVESAQVAVMYALRLGVANARLLQLALDTRGAFDLLSASLTAFGPGEFVGDGLKATQQDVAGVVAALKAKYPDIDFDQKI